jgi:hypothetical protein
VGIAAASKPHEAMSRQMIELIVLENKRSMDIPSGKGGATAALYFGSERSSTSLSYEIFFRIARATQIAEEYLNAVFGFTWVETIF